MSLRYSSLQLNDVPNGVWNGRPLACRGEPTPRREISAFL